MDCGKAGDFGSVPGMLTHLTGRSGEVVEALLDRKADVACIQETQWKGSGCKLYTAKGKRYGR